MKLLSIISQVCRHADCSSEATLAFLDNNDRLIGFFCSVHGLSFHEKKLQEAYDKEAQRLISSTKAELTLAKRDLERTTARCIRLGIRVSEI